jgi:nucleotide-binding universal stress UspA family protein
MAIKDILVHLDDTPRAEVCLAVAARLAIRHGAHLTGLHVIEPLSPDMFQGYPPGFGDLRASLIEHSRAAGLETAANVKAKFTDRMRRDGLQGEWRQVEGDIGETVALHARYADFAVVGQRDPDASNGADITRMPIAGLMAAGRPMLVVPFAGSFEALGDNVLVGWNASPESARAVNDALPLLHAARQVTVLAINPKRGIGGDGDVPAADIALHLARHGINAKAAHTVSDGIGDGDVLLSYAADIGADMLVCGMYSHSRLREAVFGGATRSLLTEMTVPVFMVH